MTDLSFIEHPFIKLILISLAVWRLSFMITSEDGAFSITYAIRLFGQNVVTPNVSKWEAYKESLKPHGVSGKKQIVVTPSNHYGKLVTCIMCTSVWIAALGVVGLYFYDYDIVKIIILILALSGGTILIQKKGF